MATYSDQTKLDRLFKAGVNKARGDNNTQFYEENIPTVVDVTAGDVYAEAIPDTPPTSTTSVVKVWKASADGAIAMTLDRKYNGNRVWVAKATHEASFSSGSGDLTNILKNFISPKYGAAYVVSVYDGDGVQISELDNASWLFDYKAGVLTFETDRTETGATSGDSISIEVCQYVGRTLADEVQTSTWVQSVSASTWTITHNLNRYPSVDVVDSGGDVCIGDVKYIDANTLTVSFSGAFSGKAYLSPSDRYRINIKTDAAPERIAEADTVILQILNDLRTLGPTAEELKIASTILQRRGEGQRSSNQYWLTIFPEYERLGVSLDRLADTPGTLFSREDIRRAAQRYLPQDRYRVQTLLPAPKYKD